MTIANLICSYVWGQNFYCQRIKGYVAGYKPKYVPQVVSIALLDCTRLQYNECYDWTYDNHLVNISNFKGGGLGYRPPFEKPSCKSLNKW